MIGNGELDGMSWQGVVDAPAMSAPASQVYAQVKIPLKIEDREGAHSANNGSHACRVGSSEYFFLVTVGFETAHAEA